MQKLTIALLLLILVSPALAFIGPGFDDFFHLLQPTPAAITPSRPLHTQIIPIKPVVVTSPTPTPTACPTPTPTPTSTPTPTPTPETVQTFTCNATSCGNLTHSHELTINTTTPAVFDIAFTPKGTTTKAALYLSNGGKYHIVKETTVANPNKANKITFASTKPITKLLLSMPNSNSPTSTITIKPDATAISTILAEDTCNTGTGYALDKTHPGNPHTCLSGKQDCCGWYVRTQAHDMNTTITQPVDIYIEYQTGWADSCQDNATFWISNDTNTNVAANNASWTLVGSKWTTATDTDGNPTFPQAWATHSMVIHNVTTPFRWVKVSAMKCYADWSYVTATAASNNTAPTAIITAPAEVTIGKKAVFSAIPSTDDGGIATYTWKFGDHSGGTGIITSHTYTGNWTWNGTTYTDTPPHDYTVQLTAKDLDGATGIAYKAIKMVSYDVDNPPVAYFTANVTSGNQPLPVAFNASLSDDDGNITSHSWSFGDTGALASHTFATPGLYNVTLTVTDDSSQTDTYTLQINVTGSAPNVTISYPVNGSYYTAVNAVNFTAVDDGTTSFDCFYGVDGDVSSTTAANNSTEVSAPLTVSGDGLHNVSVICSDGGMNGTDTKWFYIDSTPPDVTITSPINGTTVPYRNVTVYYNSTATDVNYSLAMLDKNQAPDTVYNESNETNLTGWYKDPNNSPTAFKNLGDGWHTLHVRNVDNAGNIGPEDNVTIYVDAGAPSVTILAPANDSNISASWVLVNFTTPDADVAGFKYKTDTTAWADTGITGITANTNYTWNFTQLSQGTHELWLMAVDYDGNNGTAYTTVNITVQDNLKPIVTISYPTAHYTSVDTLNFTAIDDTAVLMDCNYSIDGSAFTATASQASNSTTYSQPITVDNTSSAWHNVAVRCSDGVQWSDDATSSFYIDVDGPAVWLVDAPGRSGYYFEKGVQFNGTNYTNNATIYYDGSDATGIAYYELQYNGTAPNTTTSNWFWFNLSDGNYSLYVRGVDALGNVGNWANTNMTLDSVKPDVDMQIPGNGTNLGGPGTTSIYSSSSSDVGSYYMRLDNGAWILDPDGSPYVFDGLSDGAHYFYVKAVDYAGNEAIDAQWATVDTSGPLTVINAPLNNSSYTVDDIAVSFYSNDTNISTFQYSFDGSDWNDTGIVAEPNTTYNYTFNNVPEGTSLLYIRGEDDSGYYGVPANITVNVESLFTNLVVDLSIPTEAVVGTPFPVEVWAINQNEEAIAGGLVEVNITVSPSCSIEGTNPQLLGAINGSGGGDSGYWLVTCGISGINEPITGYMNYIPTGQTKSDTKTVGVTPYSTPSPVVTFDFRNNRIVF